MQSAVGCLTSNRPRLGFWLTGATCLLVAVDAFRPKAGRARRVGTRPRRHRCQNVSGARPGAAQNQTIPVARRALMSLPLIAFILLAGPANGSAGRHIDSHTNRSTKSASTSRTTVASAGAHNTSISTSHQSPSPRVVPTKTRRTGTIGTGTIGIGTIANRSSHSASKSAQVSHRVPGHPAAAKATTTNPGRPKPRSDHRRSPDRPSADRHPEPAGHHHHDGPSHGSDPNDPDSTRPGPLGHLHRDLLRPIRPYCGRRRRRSRKRGG